MRILLADDHRLVRDGVKSFLARLDDDVSVIEAASLDEATDKADGDDGLDLIILDLVMPGMNGLSGLVRMRALKPDVPIVIMTGFFRRDDVLAALERGAHGFIPKTLSGMAMTNALRLVIDGERYVPSRVLGDGHSLAPGFGESAVAFGFEGPLGELTQRQREVLSRLVRGSTNREIADALGLKEVTVKVHLKGVFRKLGVTNRTQAARLALEAGWRA